MRVLLYRIGLAAGINVENAEEVEMFCILPPSQPHFCVEVDYLFESGLTYHFSGVVHSTLN